MKTHTDMIMDEDREIDFIIENLTQHFCLNNSDEDASDAIAEGLLKAFPWMCQYTAKDWAIKFYGQVEESCANLAD